MGLGWIRIHVADGIPSKGLGSIHQQCTAVMAPFCRGSRRPMHTAARPLFGLTKSTTAQTDLYELISRCDELSGSSLSLPSPKRGCAGRVVRAAPSDRTRSS